MKNSNVKDWLIPLLVVFGIYIPLSTTAPSPERQSSAQPQSPAYIQAPPTVTPTPAPGKGRVPGEAARLLCDFFGFDPDQDAGLNPQQKSEVENRRGDYCGIKSAFSSKASKLGYKKIDYLIATVPDPIDTRLDHQFDRALDAIRQAIESADYTFDRFWLPWGKSKTAAPPISPTDQRTAQMATRHLRDPGVILFRDSGSKKLLLLFLVGETSTGGIHRGAFQTALQQIEELPLQKKPLRILGPYFSGSADSLAILLSGWTDGQKPLADVKIITGSTGGIKKDDFLKKTALTENSLQGTEVNTGQAMREFFKYLQGRDRWLNPPDDGSPAHAYIAVLTEAGTAKGQNARKTMEDLYKAGDEDSRENLPPSLTLTYPVHISQLRVEAEKSSLRKDVTNAPAVKDDNLPLPMSEAGSPESKDIAPLFSTLQTVTMELALGEILTAIHRERIRYVRVSAADPQDRIFLVSEIRKHCPNTTIFMQGSDLLYLHSRSNFDFHGVLVISTYPLFALNQLWIYPFKGSERRLQFSTPNEQGIYNATLALLGEEKPMLEYGFPFREYQDGEPRYPALWLGIVGRNGIWPVKVFDVQPKGRSYTLSITTKRTTSAPRLGLSGNYRSLIGVGFLLLLGGICLVLSLCLLAQLSLFRELRHGWLRLRRGWLGRLLAWLRRGWLGRLLAWLRRGLSWLLAWPRRGLSRLLEWLRCGKLGQVFGDEKVYRYHLDHRIND